MAEKAEKKAVSLQEVYEVYANEAKEDKPKLVSLIDSYDVKFNEDFKGIKAGHSLKGISKVAFDFYNANGVVSELK